MGPRRQGGSESRPDCLRRVEALGRHRRSGPSLGAHGGPAIQEHKQERREALLPHGRAEHHAPAAGTRVAWQPRRLRAGHYGKGPARPHETAGAEGGAWARRAKVCGGGTRDADLGLCEAGGSKELVNPGGGFQADCGACLKKCIFPSSVPRFRLSRSRAVSRNQYF